MNDLIVNGKNYGHIEKMISPAGNDDRMEYIWLEKYFVKVYVKLEAWRKSEFRDEIRMSEVDITYLPHSKYIEIIEEKISKKKYIFIERIYAEEFKDEYRNFNKRRKDFLVSKILDYLVLLEEKGLYHSDLRPWNLLIRKNKLYFIDISSIWEKRMDCIKLDIFLSFILFLFQIYENDHEVNWRGLERKEEVEFDLRKIPKDIREFILHYFHHKHDYVSFKVMRENFTNRKKLEFKKHIGDIKISNKSIKIIY